MPPLSAGVCDVEAALEETALELTADDDDAALLLSLRDELTALDETALEDDASLTADDSSVASEVETFARLSDVSLDDFSDDTLLCCFSLDTDVDTTEDTCFGAPLDVCVETLTIAFAALNAKIIETKATGVINGGMRYAMKTSLYPYKLTLNNFFYNFINRLLGCLPIIINNNLSNIC